MNIQRVDYEFEGILPELTDLFFKNTVEVYEDLSLSRNSYNGVPMLDTFFMKGEYYFLIFAAMHKEEYRQNAVHLTGEEFKRYMNNLVKENIKEDRLNVYMTHQNDIQRALDYKHMVYASGTKNQILYNQPTLEVW